MIKHLAVSLQEYHAAGKDILAFISRPEVCPRCGRRDAFHSHGRYRRFAGNLEICIARFRCRFCALDISILPDFAMPYRNHPVEKVDRYFEASEEERRNTGGHDTLKWYWAAWQGCWRPIMRLLGEAVDDGRAAWQLLKNRYGSIAAAQSSIVPQYGHALLKRYVIHALPKKVMV